MIESKARSIGKAKRIMRKGITLKNTLLFLCWIFIVIHNL